MADKKLSQLTAATAVNGPDALYLLQNLTDKRVTVDTLFRNSGNIRFAGNIYYDGANAQTLTDVGTISLSTPITNLVLTQGGGELKLPRATVEGAVKFITLTHTDSSSGYFISSNISYDGTANILFNKAGDSVLLHYVNAAWRIAGISNFHDMAQLPDFSYADQAINRRSNVMHYSLATKEIYGVDQLDTANSNISFTHGLIKFTANSSGDGLGYSTLELHPDNTAPNNSYIVLDPTGPNHIHIRAGGIQDNANSRLYLGGEESFVAIDAGSEANVLIESNGHRWTFDNAGKLTFPSGSSISDGNNTLYLGDNRFQLWYGSAVNDWAIFKDANLIQLQADQSVKIIAGTGEEAFQWEFSDTGNLILPDNSTIKFFNGDEFLTGTGNITFDDSNILSSTNTIRLIANSSGDAKTWEFSTDATLSLPGNLIFSGCSISSINSISNSSGDGLGAATLEIVPDTALVNNDQYIVIDPTEPDHIHVRGGGAIDNCSAKLIFGGENSHFAVQSGANASVGVRANGYSWTFNTDGTFSAPGSISSDGIVSTGKSKFDKIIESHTGVYNPVGNVTFDCFLSHVFDVTSINTNFTANLTNFELSDGEATAVTLVLNQGANAYIANALHFSGETQAVRWQGNVEPAGNVNAIDIQTFSILKVNGVYRVLGQLTTFG